MTLLHCLSFSKTAVSAPFNAGEKAGATRRFPIRKSTVSKALAMYMPCLHRRYAFLIVVELLSLLLGLVAIGFKRMQTWASFGAHEWLRAESEINDFHFNPDGNELVDIDQYEVMILKATRIAASAKNQVVRWDVVGGKRRSAFD